MTAAPLPASLPVATPESVGVPSAALTALVDGLEQGGFDPHAIAVARHGQVVARATWAPYTLEDAPLVYSLSKSFLSTAVGFAVDEGLLDLDAPVSTYLPDVPAAGGAARMRVRDLLSMAAGHEEDVITPIFGPDPVAAVLAVEPEHEPGTVFTYDQSAPFLLSAALTRVTGERVGEYLRPRLLGPLGIGPRWWTQVDGLDVGFTGFHARLDDVLALGQTYLEGGSFRGVPVLPEGWADVATSVHVDNAPRGGGPDWRQGYGFLFWRGKHGFRGDGAYGQLCLVLPEEGLVVAVLAAAEDMQAEVDVVWETLLPALSATPLPEDPAAHATLEARLAGAEVPLAPPTQHGVLHTGTLVPDGDGWTVDLDGLRFAVGSDSWPRTAVPVGDNVLSLAARGRAVDDGGWEGTAVVTTAPHRLVLRAAPGSTVVEARWHTPPLRDAPLRALAVPAWATTPAATQAAPVG